MNRILYQLTIRNMLKSKQIWFALAVSLLPFLVGLLLLAEDNTGPYEPILPFLLFGFMSFTLVVTALILAGGLMSDEVEDRTISYLLVCPISRKDLFVSRALAVLVLLAGFAVIQGLGAYFGEFLQYWTKDQGAYFDQTAEVKSTVQMSLGFFLAILLPPLIAASYALLSGVASLVMGKWHLIPIAIYVPIDIAGSYMLDFPLGPIAAASTIYEAALDTGIPAGHWTLGVLLLPGYIALWFVVGVWMTKRKDFHVTSAVT